MTPNEFVTLCIGVAVTATFLIWLGFLVARVISKTRSPRSFFIR